MNAPVQLNRIVHIVAELTRREAMGDPPPKVAEVAREFGISETQLRADLRTLTEAQDQLDGEWLEHLTVVLEGDTVQVSSRGPFRRPIRLTVEELLAIQVGLAAEDDGRPVSAGLAAVLGAGRVPEPSVRVDPAAAPGVGTVIAHARRAIDGRRLLTIRYAGERDRAGTNRVVEPHDVVYANGRHYVVAWCRSGNGWRHFRADRVLDAQVGEGIFAWRDDHRPLAVPGDTFRVTEAPDDVTVRFGAGIARWLLERYPEAARRDDGSIDVVLQVAEPAWLVRFVLQYGPDAEVIGPPEYREVMRRALGGPS